MTRINRQAEGIRRLSDADLAKELEESHRRLFSLRLQWTTRQITNYRELAQVRRRIARLKSIQKQRQLAPAKVRAAKKE